MSAVCYKSSLSLRFPVHEYGIETLEGFYPCNRLIILSESLQRRQYFKANMSGCSRCKVSAVEHTLFRKVINGPVYSRLKWELTSSPVSSYCQRHNFHPALNLIQTCQLRKLFSNKIGWITCSNFVSSEETLEIGISKLGEAICM